MTVDVLMVNIIGFYQKKSNLQHTVKAQRVHNFFCHHMNLLFLIHLENENPRTGSHLQVLVEESVL